MAEVITTDLTATAIVEETENLDVTATPALSLLNWLNGCAFALTVLATFGTQGNNRFTRGWMTEISTLSAKYQSLVTPARYTFSIWGLIFLTELLWTILQFESQWRSSWFVNEIVGYYFVWACLCQSVWSIVFSCELVKTSILPMLGILASLWPITYRIYFWYDDEIPPNSRSFWLMAFPMLLHSGWILAATLVNFNVVLVAFGATSQVQIVAGWTSLAVVILSGLVILEFPWWFGTDSQNALVVPCVLAWASLGIAKELDSPSESIATNFAPDIVSSTRVAARNGAILILIVAVVVAIVW